MLEPTILKLLSLVI